MRGLGALCQKQDKEQIYISYYKSQHHRGDIEGSYSFKWGVWGRKLSREYLRPKQHEKGKAFEEQPGGWHGIMRVRHMRKSTGQVWAQ